VAATLGLSLVDRSRSGAHTADVLSEQLQGIPSNASVVTVTVGGNDLGYSGGLVRAGLIHRGLASTDAGPVATALVEIVERAHVAAPARVVLVDHLTVIGPDRKGLVLTGHQRDHFALVVSALETAFASAAETTGALLVRASAASRDHAVGSADPWVTPWSTLGLLRGRVPYHPNLAGMTAVAGLVVEALRA
jgi:lysophospholipase L1-like esterase